MKIKPMLGDFALEHLEYIESSESRALVEHRVPGLAGSYFQDMGTVPTTIALAGTKYGDEARDNFLEGIRKIFNAGEPTTFVADINTATDLTQVVIEDLQVAEIGGSADSFRYLIKLRKYIEPPEPPAEGLLDTGILDDARSLVDALDTIDSLSSISNLGDPTPPVRQSLDNVKAATGGLDGVVSDLNDLFNKEVLPGPTPAGLAPTPGAGEAAPPAAAPPLTEAKSDTVPITEPPNQPLEIPSEAFDALDLLRQTLEEGVSGEYQFGVGIKRTAGQYLDKIALIVYIPEKKPPEDVPQSKLIPTKFNGLPTDVVENRNILLADSALYDPLCGGIEISRSGLPIEGGVAIQVNPGTLGVVVRRRSDGQRLFLTCEHVVSHQNRHDFLSQNIFQPSEGNTGSSICGQCVDASIELDAAIIDPATASPARSISNTIQGIGPVTGSNTVKGLWELVQKRGRTTGFTDGLVVGLTSSQNGQLQGIEIDGFPFDNKFCDHGDSGSAVLNNQREVVAILNSMSDENCTTCFATLIDPIREALNIDIAVGPVISSITPNYWDSTMGFVTIEGFGFESPNQVNFGDVPGQLLQEGPTLLQVIPPSKADAALVEVRVFNKWQDSSEPGPESMFEYRSGQGAIPAATPRELTYSTADVIDERISVPAQHSLVRLSKNPETSSDAVGLLEEVKAGRLAGIYCVNWEKSAKRAKAFGSSWWTVIPEGEDAVLMLDPDDLEAGQPMISFSRGLDPDCGLLEDEQQFPASPGRIDAALLKVWDTYLRWRRGEILVPCPPCDEETVSSYMQDYDLDIANEPSKGDLIIMPPGCESVEPKKLFIFIVGNEERRTVDKWELDIFDLKGVQKCPHNGELMGDACTVSAPAILKAAEFMAYEIIRDLKEYFAIIAHSRNLQDRIEIVLDISPQIKQEWDRIEGVITDQTQIDNWRKTRKRILEMAKTRLTLSTRSSKSTYIPLVGAEYAGVVSPEYLINPFTWYDSSITSTRTMAHSAERARIAFSPLALIIHEGDHDKNCIFTADSAECSSSGFYSNDTAENATVKDIDKALGAHPYIAKRFAYVGGFSEQCDFPDLRDTVDHGIRVFLDIPLLPNETPSGRHSIRYSLPALDTNRPNPGSGIVWIEIPSDSTLRSGIRTVGPYKKP